jgi:curli production assembly/transport component CsgG
MLRRSLLVLTVPLAVLVASWSCASRPPHGDPQGLGIGSGTPQAVHSQLEQQLTALATQLADEFSAHQVNRVAVLPFENTTGQKPDSLGTYLAEKITHLLFAKRPATIVERTFLDKVIDEIARGYSGRFDEGSLKKVGRLLNADTLIVGSYIRLTNGLTEVMARAVFVETGEIVGAGSTTIASNLIPNIPSAERMPLQAKRERPLLEQQAEELTTEVQGPGTFNIVPSPPPVAPYEPTQYPTYPTYPAYPTPQVIVPYYSYGYAPIAPPVIYSSPVIVIPRVFHPGSHHGRRR